MAEDGTSGERIGAFSDGVDRLLMIVRPHGRPKSSFPDGLDHTQIRQSANESLREWFIRLVDRFCDGEPKRCAVEDNIAVFMLLLWQRPRILVGANICAMVTTCDLDDFYLGPPAACETTCLRLDFDYGTLGEPFSHPLPHIHVQGELSPRFSLDGGDSGNIVLDYLEFIYRQFAPSKWKTWAECVWNEDFVSTGRAEMDNPFSTIMRAFTEGQVSVLCQHTEHLTHLKRLLRKRKDTLFDFHMVRSDREMMEYPEAR